MATDEMKAKVCLIGEATVGKTSLVRRFVLDQFGERYVASLGAGVMKKEVVVPGIGGEVRVFLMLWDIMGERGFLDLLKEPYFRGAQALLAVGDLTRPDTIRALSGWVDAARSVAGPVPLVVLGSKADLDPARGAGEAMEDLARRLDAPHRRTSAKTGDNVEASFVEVARMIVRS